MQKWVISFICLVPPAGAFAKTMTYNQLTGINLTDRGLPADQQATNVLLAEGNFVYGATSGDACHVFRFDPKTAQIKILATLDGPNTVMRGMVLHDDALFVATMLTPRQLWLQARASGKPVEFEDANLIPVTPAHKTGRLYRITHIDAEQPKLHDLGTPVPNQGIHTLAADLARGLLYGITSPGGKFFIYDIHSQKTEVVSFGPTYTNVSDHMVAYVEVEKQLADLTPGEGEWNNRLIARAMHVRGDGTLYTSGWRGQILKYDPDIEDPRKRFSAVAYIPSVPGRQHWNRIDAIVERNGRLYIGTSDGYVLRLDPNTGDIENLGKPIRAIEVMGMAFSGLDGKLYGVNGGGLEGMSRLWSLDVDKGVFEVDHPVHQVVENRRRIGDLVCTEDGALVLAEASRVGNLRVLTPGEATPWEKGGTLPEENPQEHKGNYDERDRFAGHKKIEVEVYPIPSHLHGGSGYTAVQSDREGKVYIGTAYYGKNAQLVQLDPKTAEWRSLFRSDQLTYQYGRGQGIPGKIHTKLRLGADGKIYGATKQGYEMQYVIRPDIGEGPEGYRGSQFTCHFFSYDPATDRTVDLGPGWPQEGITGFDVDTDRGYLYGATVPGVFFLVHDLKARRVFNAGGIAHPHPTRYMPLDAGTGKVYHPGQVTPEGRAFMTVWDPDEFRLRDIEIAPQDGFKYTHSYAATCGPAGMNTLYGQADDQLFEMSLIPNADGKLPVRGVCPIGVDGEPVTSRIYAIERGPDGRIYWTSLGGNNVPMAVFAWDPETETKTYLGSCALGGEWITRGHCQGMSLDPQGHLAIKVLYSKITPAQQKHWKVAPGFQYDELRQRPYYRGYPVHQPGTYYAVYIVKNATKIR